VSGRPSSSGDRIASKESRLPFETIILGHDGKPVDNHLQQKRKVAEKESTEMQCHLDNNDKLTSVKKEPNLVQALCYRGFEVIFSTSTTDSVDEKSDRVLEVPCIQVITTRTRRILQTLTLPSHAGQIVTLSSHAHTGYIFVITSNQTIYLFCPVPTQTSRYEAMREDSTLHSTQTKRVSKTGSSKVALFGNFFWVQGIIISCQDVFDSNIFTRHQGTAIQNKAVSYDPRTNVQISSCLDDKILVASADQLAIFDISDNMSSRSQHEEEAEDNRQHGTLVWTKRVDTTITAAALSGDGKAIAYVLDGEGIGVPFPYGVRTMIRDKDDGTHEPSQSKKAHQKKSPPTEGILFKSGPFLVHSATVTRLAFKGDGTNYCNNSQALGDNFGGEGNDLLMTSCSSDGSMRVFSQGTWKLLLHWDTPPGSRADWIEGITMCNLGDLNPHPKSSKGRTPSTPSRTNSSTNISEDFINSKQSQAPGSPTSSVWQSQPIPTSAVGGWISELTFRGPFPALRLSRLSFLKSGGDSWAPAHFESVAAILPPGTLLPEVILQNLCGDENSGMVIQGIWPAWNPWELHPHSRSSESINSVDDDDSLNGDAMSLLGAVPRDNVMAAVGSSTRLNTMHTTSLGGTHSPPSELRLIARHPEGKVIIMEFPLWGDADFGAMELGSPLRYLIDLKEEVPSDVRVLRSLKGRYHDNNSVSKHLSSTPLPITISTRYAYLNFESDGLCAVVSDDRKRISLTWRKPGTMNIMKSSDSVPGGEENMDTKLSRSPSDISIASTISIDSDQSQSSFQYLDGDNEPEQFIDWSAMPLPLSLPPLHLPSSTSHSDKISLIKWWPADNYGGLPKLFALTTLGTLVLYEIPPPWAATEPLMPFDDPFALNAMNSFMSSGDNGSDPHDSGQVLANNNCEEIEVEEEYEVVVLPHPDFGLGLRLEAQADGMPATAGSFKKHPLSGGRLPAEKTGKISLGDELISVNDISLIGMSFDDIISTVRSVGMNSEEGSLRMKFRVANRTSSNGASQASVCYSSCADQGLEVVRRNKIDSDADEVVSNGVATVLVGAEYEMQQEFGRVVATIRNALPSYSEGSENRSPRSLVLLPWNYGKVAPVPYEDPGVTMLVSAVGRNVTALRLELPNSIQPETIAQLTSIGSVEVNRARRKNSKADIKSLDVIKTASEGWCVAACDELGDVTLVFIDIVDDIDNTNSSVGVDPVPRDTEYCNIHAKFRTQTIFNCYCDDDGTERTINEFLLRASSIEEIATMPIGNGSCDYVSIWTSNPSVSTSILNEKNNPIENMSDYMRRKIFHRCANRAILDFRWVASGSLDAFPWLVTFGPNSAVVHRRPANSSDWISISEISYACSNIHNYQSSMSPADAFPHLIPAIRTIISASDERRFVLSDWHPDSVLAYICTALDSGVKGAIDGYLRCLFIWLSQWMDPNDSTTLNWNSQSRLSCAPITSLYISQKDDEKEGVEHSAFTSLSKQSKSSIENNRLLERLQVSISSQIDNKERENTANNEDSFRNKDKDIIENDLPESLKSLTRDELCLLQGFGEIIKKPPNVDRYDEAAQLVAFCIQLMHHIETSSYKDPHVSNETQSNGVLIGLNSSSRRSFFVKQPSFQPPPKAAPMEMASGACLSALLSDSQADILELCRNLYGRINWSVARSIMLPYWLRSDEMLKKLSEEIAQSIFKETKDVMECALFYIATGNMKMLRAIAAIDRSISGAKFSSFITSFDFSSTRGRTAAEKNAYSLLRKRRYIPAAAFFLLAKPPMLKSAIEIIATNMQDFSLAFFVSRLMDIQSSNHENYGALDGLTIGGGVSLTGLGGGAGYACGGYNPQKPMKSIGTQYENWDPKLQEFSGDLLRKRGIPLVEVDPCLQATYLLWLNRPNDAALCLLGRSYSTENDFTMRSDEDICPSDGQSPTSDIDSPTRRVMHKANIVINFCVRSSLLKRMKVDRHALWSSSMTISRALKRRGIEIPSILALPEEISNYAEDEVPVDAHNPNKKSFKPHKEQNCNDPMLSSIFDSFDVPVSKSKPSPPQVIESSIFDSFDVPTPNQAIRNPSGTNEKVNISSHAGHIPSSVYYSFGATNQNQEIPDKAVVDSVILDKSIPLVWVEWRRNILITSVARRLIREMARIIAQFEGDAIAVPNKLFRRHIHPLVSYGASRVLQEGCDGEAILSIILESLDKLCSLFDVSKEPVVEQCLLLLGYPSHPRRIVFAVLLHCLTGRADLAEDVIRDAANDQVQRCQLFSYSNDDLIFSRKTVHHNSSHYVRQEASIISWQLELCLWLHRGGAFPMTSLSLKETTAAVRIGYVVASWGRCHECLENIIKYEPDIVMDFEHGRQLWSSMKIILGNSSTGLKCTESVETTSGGWEFLVDCKRAGATEILRHRKPGTFLLRPHPEDHGVFTLSFRTNLVVSEEIEGSNTQKDSSDISEGIPKQLKRDEVVQHAIVRLSDAGFRCGSFGPFSSLLKLLEAVSKSLPFDLLFSEPPVQGIIQEEGAQPSPNSVFIRKLALHSKTEHYRWNTSTRVQADDRVNDDLDECKTVDEEHRFELGQKLGMFSQLLVLTELRKQLSAVISNNEHEENYEIKDSSFLSDEDTDNYFEGSLADNDSYIGEEDLESTASRTIRPFLDWCRTNEVSIAHKILPSLSQLSKYRRLALPVDVSASETAVELATSQFRHYLDDGGDNIIRRMIQPDSGVEFRTLRVGESGHSAVVVLFRKQEALSWLISSRVEKDEKDAISRLEAIERSRVIEEIDLNMMNIVDGATLSEEVIDIRYRFVDPWEVEVLDSKDAELRGASLGRGHYVPFSVSAVARACEETQRYLGGLHLLSLWNTAKGGICLTKALASAHPPWEANSGSDLHITKGSVSQSSVYDNSIHQHLYRNALFRRLNLPQRFLALIQVELLDLKNLTSPAGAPSLTAYALLRLKRTASNAPLTHKARTLDSACTEPRKILSISGPNAPASWGAFARFRFPLPEGVDCNGVSIDRDREALFKGVPRQLQISVYEKKFMNDMMLGGADVRLDALSSSGQVEEWVPLRSQKKDGITWFARVRLTLRFELMCIAPEGLENMTDSAGLRKIQQLSFIGGAHEDSEGVQRSVSTPDFVSYLESIVY